MIRLEAVVFDFGNVLSREPYRHDAEQMADKLGIDLESFNALYWKYRNDYDRGVSSAHLYWSNIGLEAGCKLDNESVDSLIALDVESWCRPNISMIEWAGLLARNAFKIGLLSNMPLDLMLNLKQGCDWFPNFYHETFSCIEKSIKPEAKIYEHAFGGIAASRESILFVDDRLENVDAAIKYGVHAVRFQDSNQLFGALKDRYDLPC
ncbi:MAG: hypothetical protein K8F91_14970 [Candidatus Obscuribacterales bacterium]|nr:hypothetical protein [Candidatus Obscuribacterales bacterium]